MFYINYSFFPRINRQFQGFEYSHENIICEDLLRHPKIIVDCQHQKFLQNFFIEIQQVYYFLEQKNLFQRQGLDCICFSFVTHLLYFFWEGNTFYYYFIFYFFWCFILNYKVDTQCGKLLSSDNLLLSLLLGKIINELLQLGVYRILLVEMNLIRYLKDIFQPNQNGFLCRHTSFYEIINLNDSFTLLFLILLYDLCDLVEKLLKLKPTDFNVLLLAYSSTLFFYLFLFSFIETDFYSFDYLDCLVPLEFFLEFQYPLSYFLSKTSIMLYYQFQSALKMQFNAVCMLKLASCMHFRINFQSHSFPIIFRNYSTIVSYFYDLDVFFFTFIFYFTIYIYYSSCCCFLFFFHWFLSVFLLTGPSSSTSFFFFPCHASLLFYYLLPYIIKYFLLQILKLNQKYLIYFQLSIIFSFQLKIHTFQYSIIPMFRKIFSGSEALYPQFRTLDSAAMIKSLSNGLESNMYYTPKIQKIPFSEQLMKYLLYLTRKNTVDRKDMKVLTQNIITQYGSVYKKTNLENQNFGVQRNFKIKQQGQCPYHGNIDYMIYLNQTHFFPLMYFEKELNPFCGAGLAMSNMVMKSRLRNEPKTSGYSLITNGQQWTMYKVYRNMECEKSVIYEGRNNKHRNLYQDFQMVSTVLGLIDYSLDIARQDVDTLKTAYSFIDQQRFMLQAKQGQDIKNSPASKLLLKYYQRKKDQNSK